MSRVVNVWDEIELPDMQIVDMIDPPPAFSEQPSAGPAPYTAVNAPSPIPSSPPPPFQSDDEEGRAQSAQRPAEQGDESASASDSMEEEPVDEFTAQERIAWEADRVAGLSVLMRVARSQQRREAYLARKRAAEEEALAAAEGEAPAESMAATEVPEEPTVAQAPVPSRPLEAPPAPEPSAGHADAPVPPTAELPPTSRLQSVGDSSSEAGTELSDENAVPGSLSIDSVDERRVEHEAREALRRYETEMQAHLLSRSRGAQRVPLPSDPRRRASLELSDLGLVLPKAPPRQVADEADTSEERPVSPLSEPSTGSEQSAEMRESDTSSASGSSAVQLSSPETASEQGDGSEPEDMAVDEHPTPPQEVSEQQPETSGADPSTTLSAPDRGVRRPLPPRPAGVPEGVATAQEQLYAMQVGGEASGRPIAPRRPAPPPPPQAQKAPPRRPAPPPPDSDRLASLEAFLRRNTPLPPSALAWTEHAAARNAELAAARYPGGVFSNMHSSTAPLPRQTHLPTVTDDTRHFPPSLPVLQERSLRPQGESGVSAESRPLGEEQPAPDAGERPAVVPRPAPRVQAPPVPPRRSSHAHPGVPASPSEISAVRHELASPTSERVVPHPAASPRLGNRATGEHAEEHPGRAEERQGGAGVPEGEEQPPERPGGTPERQGSLGVTDLDVLVSQLDNPSTQYEQAVALSEFLGQASPTAQLSREELQNIPVGRVEVESRRVSRSGKVKQKLSVVGVRVDRCGICLVQFRADQMACIFPCVHMYVKARCDELTDHADSTRLARLNYSVIPASVPCVGTTWERHHFHHGSQRAGCTIVGKHTHLYEPMSINHTLWQ